MPIVANALTTDSGIAIGSFIPPCYAPARLRTNAAPL